MHGRHIRLNTSSKHEKKKAYIMNGNHIRLNTSSKHEKTKSIYYERPTHQIEDMN